MAWGKTCGDWQGRLLITAPGAGRPPPAGSQASEQGAGWQGGGALPILNAGPLTNRPKSKNVKAEGELTSAPCHARATARTHG